MNNAPREYLKQMRAERNLSMQDVADAFGISRQYYNMIEQGISQKRMDITLVRKISDFFGVPFDFVVESEKKLLESAEAAEQEEAAEQAEPAEANA